MAKPASAPHPRKGGGHTFKPKGRQVTEDGETFGLFLCSDESCRERRVLKLKAKAK